MNYKQYLKIFNDNVITSVDIPANHPVIEFTGPFLSKEDIANKSNDQYLQIGPDLYLGLSGGIDDHIPHSCNSNCYVHVVGCRAILYSKVFIRKNSEISFDYSFTSTDTLETWNMDCRCGIFQCRKKISGFQTLPESLKQDAINNRYVPVYQFLNIFK